MTENCPLGQSYELNRINYVLPDGIIEGKFGKQWSVGDVETLISVGAINCPPDARPQRTLLSDGSTDYKNVG
jgi:hypothetical protein